MIFAKTGNEVKINDILGGDMICKKLREMGFTNGNKMRIVKNDVGPIIIKIGESRIILGRGMATKIMVQVA
ncbi:ferrous iron transport protein A [Haloimpatiens sp. FM7330]|uniref:FeoA family protein n=1 Tax=Haloimpatiens sp. FM7330 TaxID=3298610 RepID=UPI0036435883